MKKFLIAIVACVWSFSAFAQVGQIPSWPPFTTIYGYQGPGDVVASAFAWWGLRCYSNAYSGNVADVTDSATGNTTGTRLQCSSGTVSAVVSASACTFVTGNACSSLATTCTVACNVRTLYDQSGANNCSSAACNATQTTNAQRPVYVTSCIGSKPCMQFTAASTQALVTVSVSLAQPFAASWVAQHTATTVDQAAWQTAGANYPFGGNGGSTGSGSNTAYIGGSLRSTYAMSDGAQHAIGATYNTTTSIAVIDGTANINQSFGSDSSSTGFAIGGTTHNTFWFTGDISEVGLWGSALTSVNLQSLCHNQYAYWGTSTSC